MLEEAPAPTICRRRPPTVTASAVALAREVGYVNAGTVEFLLDRRREAYFLEMNTRLQVEHPVTELVTGLDLVELQLAVAAGEPLPFGQDEIAVARPRDRGAGLRRGPLRRLPAAGRATRRSWSRWPARTSASMHALRVRPGRSSTPYDPMLGKVIAHGPDREAARRALVDALDEHGHPRTDDQRRLPARPGRSDEFRDAAIDTAWLDRHQLAEPDPAPARYAGGVGGLPATSQESGGAVPLGRLPGRRGAGAGGGELTSR